MRNDLPAKPWHKEKIIVNLDSKEGSGTHWVALNKINNNEAFYFDSFGDLPPPKEIINYLHGATIKYNVNRYQSSDTELCGQLALQFLL